MPGSPGNRLPPPPPPPAHAPPRNATKNAIAEYAAMVGYRFYDKYKTAQAGECSGRTRDDLFRQHQQTC